MLFALKPAGAAGGRGQRRSFASLPADADMGRSIFHDALRRALERHREDLLTQREVLGVAHPFVSGLSLCPSLPRFYLHSTVPTHRLAIIESRARPCTQSLAPGAAPPASAGAARGTGVIVHSRRHS